VDRPWLKYNVLDAQRIMSGNTWRQRTPRGVIEFISACNPPAKFKSTRAIIVESAEAFQRANMEDPRSAGSTIEEPAETVALSAEGNSVKSQIKPKRILAVATEWKSKYGGVTTLNCEMCISMSELGHEVICAVVESTLAEKTDAASKRVKLIDAPAYSTVQGSARLFMLSGKLFDGFEPDVVIGHDHITGAAGLHLAKDIFEVPYVHFIHTLPEGAERHKTRNQGGILDGSRKADAQKQLCVLADLVVCIGPLLHRIVQTTLHSHAVSVVEFRPGLDKRLLATKIDVGKILATYCLFLARLEDGILKGADIACHVIAALNDKW
jgi:Glycosyltransferase Family 4